MAKTVGIGHQDFAQLVESDCFYIDKTRFIQEWWDNKDVVTLITRPRRFGKTLNISMLECFFSVAYKGRSDLFERFSVWKEERYRKLQGAWPVISISFANVKSGNYENAVLRICQIITELYHKNAFLLQGDLLSDAEKEEYCSICMEMPEVVATMALRKMADYFSRYYGKKVIILLDEYDTPMQEAYVNGYWDQLTEFMRNLFNATFMTNPFIERALMTGITRISKESIFSDLNHLMVVTTTSKLYADAFGFTEEEVFAALDEYGMGDRKQEVKLWYDGFTFGKCRDIYNPWSILNYLKERKIAAYWVNTSSNALAGKLIREGSRNVKESFEHMLAGEHLIVPIEEQIVYSQLEENEYAVWSLFVASGYLKVVNYEEYDTDTDMAVPKYELALTNREVSVMFRGMVQGWFAGEASNYNDFVKALLLGDLDAMNEYMNRVTGAIFSYFDTGGRTSGKAEPERFYHGFVLGLIVELDNRYIITSNRESGFGRYDVMLEPRTGRPDSGKPGGDAIIMEFKVYNSRREASLEDTVKAAHAQIEEKGYEKLLLEKGISKERIRKYGFAFAGKEVLIG